MGSNQTTTEGPYIETDRIGYEILQCPFAQQGNRID